MRVMQSSLDGRCCNGHDNRVFAVHNFGAGIVVLARCDLVNRRNGEGGLIMAMKLDETQLRTIQHAVLLYYHKCMSELVFARCGNNKIEEKDLEARIDDAKKIMRFLREYRQKKKRGE